MPALSRTQTIRITTGLRHMAVGAFWFSVMSVLVKLAGQRLPSMEIVFFRGILTLAMSYAIVKRARIEPVLGTNRRLLLQRGILGAAALACFLFSLTHLPLAEATLIQYMNPVFAILVAHWWFGERMGRKEWIALAASLTGVLLITRPAFLFGGAASDINPLHALIALMGGAFSGSAYATIRQMPKERPEVVVLYLPLMSVPMSLPFIATNWHMPTWHRVAAADRHRYRDATCADVDDEGTAGGEDRARDDGGLRADHLRRRVGGDAVWRVDYAVDGYRRGRSC